MHSFDPDIAQRVGVNAAVIYQNIFWWTKKNAANGKHIKDGYVWTFNSRTAFAKLFPYLTVSQIKTALLKLCDSGLVVKGEYNALGLDRTNWYAPTESANWIDSAIGQKSPVDWSEKANGLVTEGQPIPVVTTVMKPDDKHIARDALLMWASSEAVDSFIAYRRKAKKPISDTAAKRLAVSLQEIFNAGGNTDDALGLAEERGWQTVKPEWYFQSQRTDGRTNRQGSGMAAAFATVAAECAARERYRAENPEDPNDTMLWGVDLS